MEVVHQLGRAVGTLLEEFESGLDVRRHETFVVEAGLDLGLVVVAGHALDEAGNEVSRSLSGVGNL